MALPRPEGLSPGYASLASPDIPESHKFSWTFRGLKSTDTQLKFTIKIFDSGVNLVHTKTVTSGSTELSIDSLGYALMLGETYYWTVTTYNQSSVASTESARAKFKYASVPASEPIVWSTLPNVNDPVQSAEYFQDIKTNLKILGADYGLSTSLRNRIDALFLGDVVPSLSDYESLKIAIDALSAQNENSPSINPIAYVEDSLGVSDLSRIRDHIDRLATRAPQPVQDVSFDIPGSVMYQIDTLTVNHSGKEDKTINSSWTLEDIPSITGKILFNKLSPSKDVRYYKASFSYGFTDALYTSTLFFLPEDMVGSSNYRSFDTNWDGLNVSSTAKPYNRFTIQAVDKRGNESGTKTISKSFTGKVPLGIKEYQFEGQLHNLAATTYDADGYWTRLYTGPNTTHNYTFGTPQGKLWFRVRGVDESGLLTEWKYSNMFLYDPLDPPDPVTGVKWTSTTSTINYTWNASKRAEWYEVELHWNSSTIKRITTRNHTWTGLAEDKAYDIHVRAGNRAGVSKWTTVPARTKEGRREYNFYQTGSCSWRDKIVYPGGRTVKMGWRDESFVYQGEWVEIDSPHRAGPIGTHWGKNKGFWFMNYNDIKNKLAGKKIKEVYVQVQRKSFYHGYYNDQSLWFWNHSLAKQPNNDDDPGYSMFNKIHITNPLFDLGERAWVKLPNSFVENIVNGSAKGLALHIQANQRQLPYVQMLGNLRLRVITGD